MFNVLLQIKHETGVKIQRCCPDPPGAETSIRTSIRTTPGQTIKGHFWNTSPEISFNCKTRSRNPLSPHLGWHHATCQWRHVHLISRKLDSAEDKGRQGQGQIGSGWDHRYSELKHLTKPRRLLPPPPLPPWTALLRIGADFTHEPIRKDPTAMSPLQNPPTALFSHLSRAEPVTRVTWQQRWGVKPGSCAARNRKSLQGSGGEMRRLIL